MNSSSSPQLQIERLASQLRVERERLEFLLENMTEEVYFTDTAGRYTFANPAALKEFGHMTVEGIEVKKIISHMIVLRADGSVRPMEEAPPLRALAGEVIRNEAQFVRTPRSGALRHRQVSAGPIHDSQGNIVGSVAIVRDVSERRRNPLPLSDASPLGFTGPRAGARNVEIKARVANLDELEARAREIADQGPFDLLQDDTFFGCAAGRLKLRELGPDRGEVIFYERPDIPGPKLCHYTIVPTQTPSLLRTTLSDALGVIGRVRKHRRLYLSGASRIHLDEVDGLGSYLELEVVLAESQSQAHGEAVARHLLSRLGVEEASLVSEAYVDLLQERGDLR
jgi:PAS domain S-box-containing protein